MTPQQQKRLQYLRLVRKRSGGGATPTTPRVTDPGPQQEYTPSESLGYGGVEGATFGSGDELTGGSYAAQSALGLNEEQSKPFLSTPDPRARQRLQRLQDEKNYGQYFGQADPSLALRGGPSDYVTGRNIAREINRESAEENPIQHGAGKVGGMMATSMGTGGAVAKVAPSIGAGVGMTGSAGAPFMSNLGRQAAISGAEGAALGLGESEAETISGNLADAGTKGAFGAGGAMAGHTAVKGLQSAAGGIKELAVNTAKKFGVDADVAAGLVDRDMRKRIISPLSYKETAGHIADASTRMSGEINKENEAALKLLNKNPTIPKNNLYKQIDNQLVADDVVVQKVVPRSAGTKRAGSTIAKPPLEMPWDPVSQRGTSPGTFRSPPSGNWTTRKSKKDVVLVPMPGDPQARVSFRAAQKAKKEIARSTRGSDFISEAKLNEIKKRVDRNTNWDNADMHTSNAQKKKLRFLIDKNIKDSNPGYAEAMVPVAQKTDTLTSIQKRFDLKKGDNQSFQPGYNTSSRSKSASGDEKKWLDQELVDNLNPYLGGENIRKNVRGKALADTAEKSTGLFRAQSTWGLKKAGGMIDKLDETANKYKWGDYTRFGARTGGRMGGTAAGDMYRDRDRDYFKQFE